MDRAQPIQLLAWFVRLPDGKLRLATEAEAIEARRATRQSRAAIRCPRTIHSDHVRDHQCQMRAGHEGDCLFGDVDVIRARLLALTRDAQGRAEAFQIMRVLLDADRPGRSEDTQ